MIYRQIIDNIIFHTLHCCLDIRWESATVTGLEALKATKALRQRITRLQICVVANQQIFLDVGQFRAVIHIDFNPRWPNKGRVHLRIYRSTGIDFQDFTSLVNVEVMLCKVGKTQVSEKTNFIAGYNNFFLSDISEGCYTLQIGEE